MSDDAAPGRGRRSAGWVPDAPVAKGAGAGGLPNDRVAELRARVADRVPPAWRGTRWRMPLPAGTVAVLLAAVAGAAVLVVLMLGRPSAAVRHELPARGPAPAPTAAVETFPAATAPAHLAGAAPTATAEQARGVVVHVVGAVVAPGVVTLPAGSRVADAVEAAGGFTAEADVTRVNLARPVQDGEQVHVPRPGEPLPAGPPAPGPSPGTDGAAAAPGGGSAVLDLNTATAADLDALPGIGPVLSQRIVQWRDQHGRFSTIEELAEVSGIGAALLEQLRPHVRV